MKHKALIDAQEKEQRDKGKSLKDVQRRKALEGATHTDSFTDLSEIFTDNTPSLDSPPQSPSSPDQREMRARTTSALWESVNAEDSKPPATASPSAEVLRQESEAMKATAEELKRQCEDVLAEAKHAAENDEELQKADAT